jgi:16S rRNA (guanine527-N7)-methyltransferase
MIEKNEIEKYESDQYLRALLDAAAASKIVLDKLCQQKNMRFIELLIEWNQKMNLTAITDPEGVAVKHFSDSWMILPWLNRFAEESESSPYRLIDVGTGAGFPGIPLKIMNPSIDLVLLDSLKKRTGFLQTVKDELELANVTCLHSRAEEAARKQELREQFDMATARAVASLPVLCELCLPFVRINGYFIAMKSHSAVEVDQAQEAIRKLGGRLQQVVNFSLPGTEIKRSLVIIKKVSETPKAFPRKAGIPQKEPLQALNRTVPEALAQQI